MDYSPASGNLHPYVPHERKKSGLHEQTVHTGYNIRI